MENHATPAVQPRIAIDVLFHGLLDDPTLNAGPSKTIVDQLLEGGVHTVSTTVVADTYNDSSISTFLNEAYRYYLLEETLPNKVKLVYTVDDILHAYESKKLGVIMSTQGSDLFEGNLRFITIAHKLGLRIVQITYNQQCSMGSGVFEPTDTGLTRFGQQAIYEMNRLGILIDLSHVGYKTSLDAIECSSQPVVFSHSGVMELCKNHRNADDVQIKAVAAKGGLVGLCPHSVMCTDDRTQPPDVDVYINHMKYVADLVGPEYVAIGTDRFVQPTLQHQMGRVEFERTLPNFFGGFDISAKHVQGFNRFEQWAELPGHLSRRGFTEAEITGIMGGNLLRVFKQVWHNQ